MEKESLEQQPSEPTKHTRVRLASPRKQVERTIQKLTKLSETTKVSEAAMKPEKLVDLLTTLSALQIKLLDVDKEAKHDALIDENNRLKSELASRLMNNPVDDAAQRMLEQLDSERRKKLEDEIETLKSQIAKLQAKDAELLKANSGLRSTNSELTQQVQSLQDENAELQHTIIKLNSRTAEELLAAARAKLNAPSLPT